MIDQPPKKSVMGRLPKQAGYHNHYLLLPLALLLAACGGGDAAPPAPLAGGTPTPSPSPSPTPTPTPTPAPTTGAFNPAKLPDGRQRAFPTAEGFGAASTGGRGGRIIQVTNLNDSGTGSLRACMEATGARTCVFRVAGTIELLSQIRVDSGQLTVAGQTAPGGGIAIRNAPNNLTGSPLFLRAPNLIIRGIRVRPGPTSGTKQDTTDAITVDAGAENTIIDHVSLSWATDEVFNSTKASSKITLQWSLIYEGLSRSTHIQTEHSKGVFVEGSDISLHHVFMAHAVDRMPNAGTGSRIDIVNTISYDMREKAHQYFSNLQNQSDPTSGLTRRANIMSNWVSYGPSTLRGSPVYGADYVVEFSTFPRNAQLFLQGNIDGRRQSNSADDRLFLDPNDWTYVVSNPIGVLSIEQFTDALQGVRDTLSFAGAWPRDAADQRAINNFRNCSGRIIDSPTDVGGWPALANANPYPDADMDGMDDAWETATGLTDAIADADGDGFTNLEEFLNELAGDQTRQGNLIVRVGNGSGTVPAVNCGISI
ncbi:hypothetical protein WAB17_04205 [Parerythrobacter aurantius]|uniref:hypothetical protein n=1 Tax=Parerythrobacter aurantius TaxID=3127706 RepID=UPI003248D8A2